VFGGVDTGGRNTHAREAKLHPERTDDGITVLRADDLDPGVRRASGLSRRNAEAADYQDDENCIRPQTEESLAPPSPRRTLVPIAHYTESRFLPKMPIASFNGQEHPADRI
jgi:hypothetical protein